MTGNEGRGPADLGADAMPDSEHRDPPTQHGQTVSPAEGESSDEGGEGGLGDKVKSAVGGVIGKAKDMIGGDKG
jgi:hypothetical protein